MTVTDINLLKRTSAYVSVDKVREMGLVERLEATLKESSIPGYGMAAIQINEPYACFVMTVRDHRYRIVNPMIIDKYDPIIVPNEGCLSFPGRTINTDRFNYISVSYDDYDTGKQVRCVFQGTEALVYQHEYDHVAGITIFDREHVAIIKQGRNERCNCGSGKKYKHCCGK